MAQQFDTLGALFDAVAQRRFPEVDADYSVVAPCEVTGLSGVYSFTGHAVMSTELNRDTLDALGCDGIGMSNRPEVLLAMATPAGMVGVLDNLLVRRGSGLGAATLVETDAYDDHSRVRYARSTRRSVRVFANDDGLVTVGVGISGRTELGVEAFEPFGDRTVGLGRGLLNDAIGLFGTDDVIWASCAPGNARSLRAILSAGFELVGSEVLISTNGRLF